MDLKNSIGEVETEELVENRIFLWIGGFEKSSHIYSLHANAVFLGIEENLRGFLSEDVT